MKRVLVLLACLLLIGGTLAAKGSSEAAAPATGGDEPLRVVLLVNGALGDKSFFDSAENGMKMLRDLYGTGIVTKTIEMGFDQTKWEPTLLDLSEGDWDIIIVGTWQMTEALEATAPMYPEKKYIIFDTTVNYDNGDFSNVYSIEYKQNEASYVAGALAAKVTTSAMPLANAQKTIGFLGGMDIPVINDFLIGYIEGAQYVDKGVRVAISYIGNFEDSAKGKEMALAQYRQGVDIGYNVAGQAGLGQLDAAKDVQRYALGVDSDQALLFSETDPAKAGLIVSSVLKRVDNSLYRGVKRFMDGDSPFGTHEILGFAEDCVGLARNDVYAKVVPADIRAFVDDIEAKIVSGQIEVSTAFGMTTEQISALRDAVKP